MSTLYWFWHGMIVHLWQTTLVLALIFIIEQSLRGAPSRVRHTLWSIGLAKLFLPLSVFGGISGLLYRAAAGGSAGRSGAAAAVLQPVTTVLYPFRGVGVPAAGSALSYALVAATACWTAFALFFIVRIIVDIARTGRHGGRALAAQEGALGRRLAGILDGAGIPRERLLVSARFVMPTVVGMLRPRIVLPEHLARELPEEELRAILLHEEAHRRRRDPLRAAAQRLSMALFFFYPLMYPVLRRLHVTAEFACDESVVHSGVSGDAYSRALARTLELGLASPVFATAAVAGSSLLRRRLARLSTFNPGRYAMRLQYRILIVIAAVVVSAATFYPAPMRADRAGKPDSSKAMDQTPHAAFPVFDTAPVLLKSARPVYPEEARKQGVEATVLLEITVDDSGKVTKAQAIDPDNPEILGQPEIQKIDSAQLEELRNLFGDKTIEAARMRPLFERSAIDAAMKFVFKPATYKGKAVPSNVAVPIRFKLH